MTNSSWNLSDYANGDPPTRPVIYVQTDLHTLGRLEVVNGRRGEIHVADSTNKPGIPPRAIDGGLELLLAPTAENQSVQVAVPPGALICIGEFPLDGVYQFQQPARELQFRADAALQLRSPGDAAPIQKIDVQRALRVDAVFGKAVPEKFAVKSIGPKADLAPNEQYAKVVRVERSLAQEDVGRVGAELSYEVAGKDYTLRDTGRVAHHLSEAGWEVDSHEAADFTTSGTTPPLQ